MILEGVKVICFATLLQVLILNDLGTALELCNLQSKGCQTVTASNGRDDALAELHRIWAGLRQAEACPTKKQKRQQDAGATRTAHNIN